MERHRGVRQITFLRRAGPRWLASGLHLLTHLRQLYPPFVAMVPRLAEKLRSWRCNGTDLSGDHAEFLKVHLGAVVIASSLLSLQQSNAWTGTTLPFKIGHETSLALRPANVACADVTLSWQRDAVEVLSVPTEVPSLLQGSPKHWLWGALRRQQALMM